jgi:eukaryotic-like serine/threonine-protein kinase
MRTQRSRAIFLVVTALLPLILASCVSGRTQLARGWSGTAIHDGVVYVGTTDGRVVAINASTQSRQWEYAVTPATTLYATPIVVDGLVYVGTYSGHVLAFSGLARAEDLPFPQKREGEWSWDCPADGARSRAIVADLVMREDALYIASSNGRVYSLDRGSGDESWRREDVPELAQKLWKSPAVGGDAVCVSTFDGYIYALSLETGELLDWSFKSRAGFVSSPIIHEGIIYVGAFDNSLYAIRVGDSELLWRFAGGKWFWAAPSVSEGVVYAGCLDGRLYAVDAETGEELWRFETRDAKGRRVPIVSPPVLMDSLLIVVDELGAVYVLDIDGGLENQGVPREPIQLGGGDVRVRGSFCAHEGMVYVRDEDNRLYAVDIDQGMVTWSLPLTVAGGG